MDLLRDWRSNQSPKVCNSSKFTAPKVSDINCSIIRDLNRFAFFREVQMGIFDAYWDLARVFKFVVVGLRVTESSLDENPSIMASSLTWNSLAVFSSLSNRNISSRYGLSSNSLSIVERMKKKDEIRCVTDVNRRASLPFPIKMHQMLGEWFCNWSVFWLRFHTPPKLS
jgi:hypothetical protein